MSGYSKSTQKLVFKMSKDQYVGYDRARPLMKIVGENEVKTTDYAIKTDLKVGHNGDWNDVKKMVIKLHFHQEKNETLPGIFKVEKIKKSTSCKQEYTQITLPNKKEIIEGNTEGYLVLIPRDQENIIMPRYYNYLMDALEDTDEKGKFKMTIIIEAI